MTPTLAFTLMTRERPGRVRDLVETMRPHVDEVVVGVDDSAPAGTVAAIADLCDRVFRFPGMRQASVANAFQVLACTTDWVLRFDEDETPSHALLDALPSLVADRRVSQFELRRLWLWPDADRCIASHPWGFEPSARLTRNVGGLLESDGRLHSYESARGEKRYVPEAAFYHSDLLRRDHAARRRKIADYQGLRGELRYGDFPVNAIYLPEEASGLELADVPAVDRERVRRLVDPPVLQPGPDPEVERVTQADLARPNLNRMISAGAYAGTVALVDPPTSVAARSAVEVAVRISNEGDEWWPAGDRAERRIRVAWRWKGATGSGRHLLTETVLPGTASLQVLRLHAPVTPGACTLEVRLVHEHVRWFGEPTSVPVTVTGDPTAPLFRSAEPIQTPDGPESGWVRRDVGGWVLWLREGETPSEELLDALPELTADRRVSWFDVRVGDHFEPRLVRDIAGSLGGAGEHRLAPGAIHGGQPGPPPRPAPVPPATYGGRLELLGTPPSVRAGVIHQQELRVVNESDAAWPAGDDDEALPIRIGWRWRAAPDAPVLFDGRDLLTATLRPGEALHQVLTVRTPETPGTYVLQVELVHEHVRWFGAPASATLSVVQAREHRLLA